MIPKIKQRFWNTISSGLGPDHDLEVLRKIFLLNLIMILGGFFLALLGSLAIVQQDFVLAAGDFAILAFIAGLFIYLRKSRNHQLVGFIGTVVTGGFYFLWYQRSESRSHHSAHEQRDEAMVSGQLAPGRKKML